VVLFGLGQGLVFPTVLLWVEELVPADRQGQFSSYVAMAGYIGSPFRQCYSDSLLARSVSGQRSPPRRPSPVSHS